MMRKLTDEQLLVNLHQEFDTRRYHKYTGSNEDVILTLYVRKGLNVEPNNPIVIKIHRE